MVTLHDLQALEVRSKSIDPLVDHARLSSPAADRVHEHVFRYTMGFLHPTLFPLAPLVPKFERCFAPVLRCSPCPHDSLLLSASQARAVSCHKSRGNSPD